MDNFLTNQHVAYIKERSPLLIGISGSISSGKTTLSRNLSTFLGGVHFSVSDLLKQVACSKGMQVDRHILQEIGSEFIASGWENFVESFLDFSQSRETDIFIVDGIRHIEFWETLCTKQCSRNAALIYLTSNQKEPKNDLNIVLDDLSHPSEGNLAILKERADILVEVVWGNPYETAVTAIDRLFNLAHFFTNIL